MVMRLSIDTAWQAAWQPDLIGTLLFVLRGQQVLLIHKKTGHGQGLINGPGGKLEPGETLTHCAQREVEEEVGLVVANAQCRAELRFVERNGKQWLGYAFTATQFSGQLKSTPEAEPFWVDTDAIPYDNMLPDDRIWLPHVLGAAQAECAGQSDASEQAGPLTAEFLLESDRLLDYRLHFVSRHSQAHEGMPNQGWSLPLDCRLDW